MAEKKRGLFRRWITDPRGTRYTARVVRTGLEGAQEGIGAIKPKRFSRRGFFGNEPDGGIARFRIASNDLASEEIDAALFKWERDRGLFMVTAVALLACIPVSALYGVLNFKFAVCLIIGSAFLGIHAIVCDFRAWQIQQARFGAPVEYLNHRLPRNMQIIEKGRQ